MISESRMTQYGKFEAANEKKKQFELKLFFTTNSLGDLEGNLSGGRIISGPLQRGKHHDMVSLPP